MQVLLWGGAISVLVWSTLRFGKHWDGAVYHIVQFLWLSVLLSQLLGYSAACWPTGECTFPVVPLTLLGLAAVSALKGSDCTASGIGVLFWVVAFLLGIVFAAGIPEIKTKYLLQSTNQMDASILLVYIIPAAIGFIEKKKDLKVPIIAIVILGSCVALWICGILSSEIAETVAWPFYESAKGVQIFDVAKRLESLVSAAVTVSNYALYSMLLCAVGNIGKRLDREREAVVIATAISASLMLLGIQIDAAISAIICMVLWIFLPLLGLLKRKMEE